MSDIERDLEDLGQRIWSDPEQVRRRAVPDGDVSRPRMRRRLLGPLGTFLGTGVAMALIGSVSVAAILQLQHHLIASPAATNPTPGPATVGAGGNAGPVGAIGSSAQASPAATGRLLPSPLISSPPSPSVHAPPPGGTLTITQSSRGTFVVRRGVTITVDLTGGSAGYTWSMPSSAPNQIVHFSSGSRPGTGEVAATFVAAASGQATIRAALSPNCSPTCGLPAYLWRVSITVVP